MKSHLAKLTLALLSAAFLLGCQEQASGPVGPDGLGIQAKKGGNGKGGGGGGGGGGGTKVTWDFADHEVDGVSNDVLLYTLQSTCGGTPGSKPSNPTVEWKDGEDLAEDGCVTVKTTDGTVLTNDAYLIVATKKGSTKVTLQFQIQDIGGADGIQYRTDRFFIDSPEFAGAGFTMHVHSTVAIYELKGHTGGPKVRNAGNIHISDVVYR